VLERPLRFASIVLSLIVLLGFALFAIDEAGNGTRESSAGVGDSVAATVDPSPRQEAAREKQHGTFREAVDDANDVVLTPFAWAAPDDSGAWVRRTLPALLALAVYGFGLSYLARFSHARA
jgi:hypothetical protein